MKKTFAILTTLILVFIPSQAQKATSLISPEVHPDNKISFRYYAPDASKVLLRTEMLTEPAEMLKDQSGVWSVTIDPVKPDIYPYCFVVDGIQVSDPNNTLIFPNERFKYSLADIKGNNTLVHSLHNVPHGKVSYRYYTSSTLGETRTLLVYTPPGFDISAEKKYPVLYLIHGATETEETWTKVGRANLIADNLLVLNKIVPMIIVMPYANVSPAPPEYFTRDMMNDIIPFIEDNYPVFTDSKNTAVAGFSEGGGRAINIGLTNPDKFGYLCPFAPATDTEEFKKKFSDWYPDTELFNEHLILFSVYIATRDHLYESVIGTIAMFKEKGLRVETHIARGAHNWINCRLYLTNTMQLIFR